MRILVVLAMLALGAPLRAQDGPPPTLTIDDLAPRVVRDRAELARALRPCIRARRCDSIALETCDRCWIIAERSGKGYTLHMRTGPPGPFYVAARSGATAGKIFTLQEAQVILAGNFPDGRCTPDWYRWVEEDVFQ